eukprot:gene14199-15681_t
MEKVSEHASVIYGKQFPGRIFVGCLPEDVTALELGEYFTKFGKVLQAKILRDDCGRSKRFGFISFQSEESVQKVLEEKPIVVKGKVINVGPAVKKDGSDSPRTVSPDIGTHTDVPTAYNTKSSYPPSNGQQTCSNNISPQQQAPMYIRVAVPVPRTQPTQQYSMQPVVYSTSFQPQAPTNALYVSNQPYIQSQYCTQSMQQQHGLIPTQQAIYVQQPQPITYMKNVESPQSVAVALNTVLAAGRRKGNDLTRYNPNNTYYCHRLNVGY